MTSGKPLCDLILPDGTNYKISESPEKKSWLGKEKSFAVFRAGGSPDLIHFLEVAAELLERIKTSGGDRVMTASKAPGLSLELNQEPPRDFLDEALRIVRGESRLLAQRQHLVALAEISSTLFEALEAAVKFDRMASANLDTLIESPLGPSPWMEKALAALAKARGGR